MDIRLTIICFVLLVTCGYLVVDGLVTGSVWIKGGRRLSDWGEWAHKRSKHEEPFSYYFFMSFYLSALLFAIYHLV